ncbi:MAG TPA: ABC transporter substrate-binding protein [Microbacteriaceae bacterium]|nr:ABC transporter substrate-binding protein [Microbacteriaceae bacterium]
MNKYRHRIMGVAAAIGLAVTAAGCAGSPAPAPIDDSSATAELTDVRVAIMPLSGLAPFFLALDNGYFEEEGLRLETEMAAGGAAVIPALIAGDYDIGIGNAFNYMNAAGSGLDLQIITHIYSVTSGTQYDGIFTMPDSGIKTPADLVGKTIAINTIHSVSDFQIVAEMESLGFDRDDYQFVEMPFPDMPAALEQGHVDAAMMAEPFFTQVQEQIGATPVLSSPDRFSSIPDMANLPFGVFSATGGFIAENPEIVSAFQRAFDRARDEVIKDPQLGLDAFLNHSDMDPSLASKLSWPNFERAQVADFERMLRLMDEVGYLEGDLDVNDVLAF